MSFFEKNIKDRFKDVSSLEGINSDDLWKDIESALDKEPANSELFLLKNRSLWLLLFIAAAGFMWFQGSNPDSKIGEVHLKNETVTELAKIENSIQNSSNFQMLPLKAKTADQSNSESENSKLSTQVSSSENMNKSSKRSNTIQSEYNKKHKHKNSGSIGLEMANSNLLDNSNNSVERISLAHEQYKTIKTIKGIKEQDNEFIGLDFTPKKFKRKKTRFHVGVYGGLNTMINSFSAMRPVDEHRSKLLTEGYQEELGTSFALEAGLHFGRNKFVLSGFEYNQSTTEFNLTQTKDTTIGSPNSPSGYTDAVATRIVKHHNKLSYYSIPLLVGIQKSIGRLEYGASIGMAINLTQRQTGKALDRDNVITVYPSSETDYLPVSRVFMSYHLRPHLNYRIGRYTTVQFRANVGYQYFGRSDFYNLNHSSYHIGLGVGLQYQF